MGESLVALRFECWAGLLKVSGSVRKNDLTRLRPQDIHLKEGGLCGRLLQTKMSGKNVCTL